MIRFQSTHSWIIFVAAAMLVILVTAACGSNTPAPAPQPQAQPTQPPVKETVIVKETVVIQQTAVAPPTVVPNTPVPVTATPTVTPTKPSGSGVAPVATKTPARGAKLEFTADDIEYSSVKRKGDNKIQLTITLRPKGGVPPYYFVLDPGGVQAKINGLTFTFDWHNCGPAEPHSIVLYSADGQKAGPVSFIPPYPCD